MTIDRSEQPRIPGLPYEPPAGRVLGTIAGLTQSKGGASTDSTKGAEEPGHISLPND